MLVSCPSASTSNHTYGRTDKRINAISQETIRTTGTTCFLMATSARLRKTKKRARGNYPHYRNDLFFNGDIGNVAANTGIAEALHRVATGPSREFLWLLSLTAKESNVTIFNIKHQHKILRCALNDNLI